MLIVSSAILASVASEIGAASAEPAKAGLKDILALKMAVYQSDRRGDFDRAVGAAEQCIAKSVAYGANAPNFYCIHYLSSALKTGRGITRDQERAFELLKGLVALDPNDDAALDLVEDYLDGAGTSRNPIEAAVVFWRVEHGAWSSYSDYLGMCKNCEDFHAHEKAVEARLARELTPTEKYRSEIVAEDRFPDIAAHAKQRDRKIETTVTVLAALAGSLLYWRRRNRKRIRISTATNRVP
jgi:hypothetical protein